MNRLGFILGYIASVAQCSLRRLGYESTKYSQIFPKLGAMIFPQDLKCYFVHWFGHYISEVEVFYVMIEV